MNSKAIVEWEAWKDVCRLLLKTGAVTQEDLGSPVKELNTDGQKLFESIRRWGDSLVALKKSEEVCHGDR